MNLNNLVQYRPDILNDLPLPDGMNQDIMRETILLHAGMLTPIYPEPDFFRKTLLSWFTRKQWNIERLWRVAQVEYKPLENFDRHEIVNRTINRDNNQVTDTDISINRENELTDTVSRETNVTNNATSEGLISAYNADTYQPDSQGNTNSTAKSDANDVRSQLETSSDTHVNSERVNGSGKDVETAENHLYGNIGVTTSQQMFQAEVDLARVFNVYDTVAEMFASEMTVGVW